MDWNKVPEIMVKKESKDFRGLNLSHEHFRNEDLHEIDFSGAYCAYTIFYKCNLNNVNFSNCNLSHTIFNQCELLGTIFDGVILYSSSFYYCNIDYIIDNDPDSEMYVPAFLYGDKPEWRADCHYYGSDKIDGYVHFNICNFRRLLYTIDNIIGYKICSDICGNICDYNYKKFKYLMTVLEVDSSTPRIIVENGKCRAAKAKVLDIYDSNGYHYDRAYSCFTPIDLDFDYSDDRLIYRAGETITADGFNPSSYIECTHGIHFFMTEQEAWNFVR